MHNEHYYQALASHDSRFDGHFFVGVSSTGIYCRPVCRVRTPKQENCVFYKSAAQAEAAGFRPCLKCRPELSPPTVIRDQHPILSAITQLEDRGELDFNTLALAKHLNISERHLRRQMSEAFGISPSHFLLTRRLLRSKKLLTETDLAIADIAYISGFSSLRSFNTHFKNRYHLTPSHLRRQSTKPSAKQAALSHAPAPCIQLMLQYRPPYDWHHLIAFLQQRTVHGVEHVQENAYIRTVNLIIKEKSYCGWLMVRPHMTKANTLAIDISESLSEIIPILLNKLEHQFDLHAEPELIAQQLGSLGISNPGIRLPGSFDGFEMAVRAILGQQVTVKAAHTLAGRFAKAFGEKIETPYEHLTTLFPSALTASELSIDQIASLGIISKRAETIKAVAQKISQGDISLQPTASPEEIIKALQEITGIGHWTAHYIAMRALHWPDAFPHTDLGIMKALNEKRPKALLTLADSWRPWRSYAVMHLWQQLSQQQGSNKQPSHKQPSHKQQDTPS